MRFIKYSFVFLLFLCTAVIHGQSDFSEEGDASYYADKFHGRPTASGEVYDMHAHTAAHKKLPFGTWVRVMNLENNKSAVARINDRGPFSKNRIIDLSKTAAEEIDMVADGVVKVRISVIKDEEIIAKLNCSTDPNQQETENNEVPMPPDPPKEEEEPNNNSDDASESGTTENSEENTSSGNLSHLQVNFIYDLSGNKRIPNGYGVQVGSFAWVENAVFLGKKLKSEGFDPVFILTEGSADQMLFKIITGKAEKRNEAKQIAEKLRSKGFGGFIKKFPIH